MHGATAEIDILLVPAHSWRRTHLPHLQCFVCEETGDTCGCTSHLCVSFAVVSRLLSHNDLSFRKQLCYRIAYGFNPALVSWGLCDPSPLWLTFFFWNCHEYWHRLSRIFA